MSNTASSYNDLLFYLALIASGAALIALAIFVMPSIIHTMVSVNLIAAGTSQTALTVGTASSSLIGTTLLSTGILGLFARPKLDHKTEESVGIVLSQ